MPYCPKCGNLVDENMTFCPRCGAPLKSQAAPQAQPPRRDEKQEKNEKNQDNEKREKQEKGEHGGFIGYLIGGLVLIIIGVFSLLSISGIIASPFTGAFILVLIGVVIIIAAVYAAIMARKRSPRP
ncbi:MAG: zinc-ribbon domain-containing protein [Candidatus Bathyarchaeia archaeon]|jgi:predicted lipid-binding transport protein (Tim44 family)